MGGTAFILMSSGDGHLCCVKKTNQKTTLYVEVAFNFLYHIPTKRSPRLCIPLGPGPHCLTSALVITKLFMLNYSLLLLACALQAGLFPHLKRTFVYLLGFPGSSCWVLHDRILSGQCPSSRVIPRTGYSSLGLAIHTDQSGISVFWNRCCF